ncbi:hypothetical protein E0K83_16895 [Gramella sp. BOM4]|nr:hypothetical protein [Christiangramia bathymodioli]
MSKTFLHAIIFVIFSINCLSQKKNPSEFIPDGYILSEHHTGDLNYDKKKDHVLIIKDTREEAIIKNRAGEIMERNRRGIIILLDKGDDLEKVVENKDCFISENEDGGVYFPPELSFQTLDNFLHIHFSRGRYGYKKYIFRYEDSSFRLISFEISHNYGPKVLKRKEIDFIKMERTLVENINKYGNAEEESFQVVSNMIEIEDRIKLSEIEKFEDLEFEAF